MSLEYKDIENNNNKRSKELFQQLFPGIPMTYEHMYAYLFELLLYLSETGVNINLIPKVIRGVNNIVIGNGKGTVVINIHDETMNVEVRETDGVLKVRI